MGDEADADWQDGLGEWGREDAVEWYRNRTRKTEPKRGLSWCPRCDRNLIGEREKCSVCGFKDTASKHRRP